MNKLLLYLPRPKNNEEPWYRRYSLIRAGIYDVTYDITKADVIATPHRPVKKDYILYYSDLWKDFDDVIDGMRDEPLGGSRCYRCYLLRLCEAAKYASSHNFSYFTTTLSISPYKNAKWLNEIGEDLSGKYDVKYLYADFKKRNGYKRSIELSNIYNLYRQDYCGCIYSKRDVKSSKNT